MDTKKRNLLITVIVLVVVMVAAYFVYELVLDKTPVEPASFVPQIVETKQEPVTQVESPAVDTSAEQIEEPQPALEDEPAVSEPTVPDLQMVLLDGTVSSFDKERAGRPAVINFWATWCPPCKMELPSFDVAYQQYADDIAIMLLAAPDGQRETVSSIESYVAQNKVLPQVYLDEGWFAYLFGVTAFPTTVFINADGTVSHGYIGYIPEEVLMKDIQELVGK